MLNTAASGTEVNMTNKINEWLTEEKLSELKSLADGGETMKAIATHIGISVRTLEKWRAKYPEIASVIGYRALSDGERVEKALLRRAVGYTQTEITRQKGKDGKLEIVKTVEKQVMPSTTAQIFWLKNKCGYEWDSTMRDENEEDEGGVVVLPEIDNEQ